MVLGLIGGWCVCELQQHALWTDLGELVYLLIGFTIPAYPRTIPIVCSTAVSVFYCI